MELCVKTKWYKNGKGLSHLSLLPLFFSGPVCSPFHSSAPYYPPKPDLSPVLLPPVLSLAFRLTSHVSSHVPIKPGQVAIALPLTHVTFPHCPQLKRFSRYAGCLRWFVLDGNFSGWQNGSRSLSILSFSHCTAALMFLFLPGTCQWWYLFLQYNTIPSSLMEG